MIFQQYSLFPWKTVRENVEFGLKIKKLGKAEAAERNSTGAPQFGQLER